MWTQSISASLTLEYLFHLPKQFCSVADATCNVVDSLRRALQGLATSLGPLLADRQWQQGSYSADVLVALVGDAAVSGALALNKAEELRLTNSNSSTRPGMDSQTAW